MKVLVLGASPKSERYSYKATQMLRSFGHEAVPVGHSLGFIGETEILKSVPEEEVFDTVTLYLSPQNQEPYYQTILDLKPRRVIFNPGTENPNFETLLNQADIETEEACTLVLLSTGQF